MATTLTSKEENICIIQAIKTHKKALQKNAREANQVELEQAFKEQISVFDGWMNECKANLFDQS